MARVGYSGNHRPNRSQVTVGEHGPRFRDAYGIDRECGNILDVTYFDDTLKYVLPILPKGATIVFNNRAYSMDNTRMLDSNGLGFVTHMWLRTHRTIHSSGRIATGG